MNKIVTLILNKIFSGFPEKLESLKRLLIFPIISVAIVGFIMLVVVSKPIGVFNSGLTNFINSIGTSNLILTYRRCQDGADRESGGDAG